MTTAEAIRLVMSARTPQDLFGDGEPVRCYRRLARLVHPDRVDAAERAPAAAAFVRLTQLWQAGQPVLLGGYRLAARRHVGDIADLFDAGDERLVKIPRDPSNNDLMEREARALRALAEYGDPRFLPYVPRPVDTLRHRDSATGALRRINVVASAAGLHSLLEVRRAYPDGLDPRDAAWIWRRLLVALGFAHRAGVVHGAVLPPHVLVQPAEHGLVLVDWCYSVSGGKAAAAERLGPGQPIPALVPSFVDWYPAEVHRREPAGPGTDIAMAARCLTDLMGTRVPPPLAAFAAGCTLPARRQRPNDAWRLLAELDDVLERLYGRRVFRPFTL
jgi:hypothetical protein